MWRACIIAIVFALIFFIPLPRKYYTALTQHTDYSKIDWVENRLNEIQDLSSKELFVGSSICMNGINDSILNQGNPEGKFINLGFTHTCFAITDALVDDIINRRKQKPAMVYLCIKGDAIPTRIHNMYPLFASPDHIIQSIPQGNTYWLATILKKASWNIHSVTSSFKYKNPSYPKNFDSRFGYHPSRYSDAAEVEKIYRRNVASSEKTMLATDALINGQVMPWRHHITRFYFNFFENIQFQKNIFAITAKRLEEAQIPYCFIQYPNLITARMGRPDIMSRYFQIINPQIDFVKHRIIVPDDTVFANARYYNDMNHLNPTGAALLTRFIQQKMY
jgi:hypothetical protein